MDRRRTLEMTPSTSLGAGPSTLLGAGPSTALGAGPFAFCGPPLLNSIHYLHGFRISSLTFSGPNRET